jgi:hypothetical protein
VKTSVTQIAVIVLAAAGVYVAGILTVTAKGPQNDGDPVGFAFARPAANTANQQMSIARTVPPHPPCAGTSGPCDVTIQYFASPCPTSMTCTLPTCPSGAECIEFNGTAGIGHTDHHQEDSPHLQENIDAKGIIILQAPQRSPPPH